MKNTGEQYKVTGYKGQYAFVCASPTVTVKNQITGEKEPLANVLHQGSAEECHRYSDYYAMSQAWLAECKKAGRILTDCPEFQA